MRNQNHLEGHLSVIGSKFPPKTFDPPLTNGRHSPTKNTYKAKMRALRGQIIWGCFREKFGGVFSNLGVFCILNLTIVIAFIESVLSTNHADLIPS